ncbi:biotin--[acetyl-CoA-carboxylase] ligase [Lichenihabitans sp. Uapishka_5]|uniref:biotin--[acetyl-CoA-carboxylase] ligase n=1 Tax=Lichenihabitans sp. Uapishka_5 TaxID=3037302 RepID=UPI0029E7FD4A|nr:biotin--[acetyl-CoA-carboxylase] ligase [Lichenihabitans sp. Uapishka_5]MDX7951189.1 biotin--[acetyl-CoA-carboxylase] ligase [Lichenihabitans sp. Uapishka_5]
MTLLATEIETAPVQALAETGSTNADALALARAGQCGPLWIRADLQRSGRGRQGKPWVSPPGNLYCSLLFSTDAAPRDVPQLAQVTAVAVADAVRNAIGGRGDLRIKWPNDVLLDGAKVAGILVESTLTPDDMQACVIGCGINCISCPDDLPYRATSLAEVAGSHVEADAVFAALRATLGSALASWDAGRNYAAIRERWLAQALPLDTPLVVRGAGNAIHGLYRGIDIKGRLLLMGPQGPVAVEAGDVTLN